MRIIFSRKGFDSAAGGGPSPIVNGQPVSLPIPASVASETSYGDLGLGALVATASRGRLGPDDLCHRDPMFLADGTCLFGQCGAAQTHLANQGVGAGDVFLFFGLFRDQNEKEPHHRIFGYLQVANMVDLQDCSAEEREWLRANCHPHAITPHGHNDMIYVGEGRIARRASPALRLTVPGGPPSQWQRPGWLKPGGLTYHDRADRWNASGQLRSVARGQEFVAEAGQRKAPRDWLSHILAEF